MNSKHFPGFIVFLLNICRSQDEFPHNVYANCTSKNRTLVADNDIGCIVYCGTVNALIATRYAYGAFTTKPKTVEFVIDEIRSSCLVLHMKAIYDSYSFELGLILTFINHDSIFILQKIEMSHGKIGKELKKIGLTDQLKHHLVDHFFIEKPYICDLGIVYSHLDVEKTFLRSLSVEFVFHQRMLLVVTKADNEYKMIGS
ncbi:hypothetical protein A3Q56_06353, partial [Intoshia linei]